MDFSGFNDVLRGYVVEKRVDYNERHRSDLTGLFTKMVISGEAGKMSDEQARTILDVYFTGYGSGLSDNG